MRDDASTRRKDNNCTVFEYNIAAASMLPMSSSTCHAEITKISVGIARLQQTATGLGKFLKFLVHNYAFDVIR